MTNLQHLVGLAPLTVACAAAMTFGAAYVRGLTRSTRRRPMSRGC